MRNVSISVDANGLDWLDEMVIKTIISEAVAQIEDYMEFLEKIENEESEED